MFHRPPKRPTVSPYRSAQPLRTGKTGRSAPGLPSPLNGDYRGKPFIGMFGLRESTLNRLLAEAHAVALRVDRAGKPWQRWRSLRYFVTKPA